MKRFLAIAAIAAGLAFFTSGSNASAADFYGGHHGGHSYGHANYGHNSFGHSNYRGFNRGVVQSYRPNYSYGSSVYGRGYAQPSYGGGYTPSYGHGHNNGLHLDIGRLHIGVGGHH